METRSRTMRENFPKFKTTASSFWSTTKKLENRRMMARTTPMAMRSRAGVILRIPFPGVTSVIESPISGMPDYYSTHRAEE